MIIGLIENEDKLRELITERIKNIEIVRRIVSWENAEMFLKSNDINNLDICLVDIGLGDGMDGVTLTGLLSQRHPNLKIIILSSMNSEEIVFKALKNGAVGFINKSEIDDLEKAITNVAEGGAIISSTIALRVIDYFQNHRKKSPEIAGLSPKENQVLELLVEGQSPADIASFLGVALTTIRFHIRNIYKKLEVSNRTQLMLKMKGNPRV